MGILHRISVLLAVLVSVLGGTSSSLRRRSSSSLSPGRSRPALAALVGVRGGSSSGDVSRLAAAEAEKELADASHRNGDLDAAIANYQAAIDQCLTMQNDVGDNGGGGGGGDDHSPATAALIYKCLLNRALCHLKAEHNRAAVEDCTALLQALPTASPTMLSRAFLTRARALRRGGLAGAALEDVQRSVALAGMMEPGNDQAAADQATAAKLKAALEEEIGGDEEDQDQDQDEDEGAEEQQRRKRRKGGAGGGTIGGGSGSGSSSSSSSSNIKGESAAQRGDVVEADDALLPPLSPAVEMMLQANGDPMGGMGGIGGLGDLFGGRPPMPPSSGAGSAGGGGGGLAESLFGAMAGASGSGAAGGGLLESLGPMLGGMGGLGGLLGDATGLASAGGGKGGGAGGKSGGADALAALGGKALEKLKDPKTAAGLASVASSLSPELLMSLLSLEEGRAKALHGFLQKLTAERIAKYVKYADRGLAVVRRGRKAWKAWKKYTDLRIALMIALWVKGALSALP